MVILIVGAPWRVGYGLCVHTAVIKQAGFDVATVGTLVAGQELASLSTEENLAHGFTCRLTAAHQIASALYQQAVATFGEKGVVDLICLAGQYIIISGLLNTFAVPAPATIWFGWVIGC